MHRRSCIRPIALLAAWACSLAGAQAGMYRWVDENGVTVYSQTAPPSGEAIPIRKQPGPSAEETAKARERLRGQVEQSFDAKEDAKQAQEKEADQAGQAKESQHKKDNCQAARQNLQALENLGARMVRMPNGEYTRLPEDEVVKRKEEARAQVKEYCD
jgi:hypothetical protein